MAKLAAAKAKRKSFNFPNHFLGIVAGGCLREECLLDIIRNLPQGVSEVMVHPGDNDAILSAECGWSHHFQEELNAVCSTQTANFLQKNKIESHWGRFQSHWGRFRLTTDLKWNIM
nr:ChbG/HpnK family deacetylase [Sporomusa acidovorans]